MSILFFVPWNDDLIEIFLYLRLHHRLKRNSVTKLGGCLDFRIKQLKVLRISNTGYYDWNGQKMDLKLDNGTIISCMIDDTVYANNMLRIETNCR